MRTTTKKRDQRRREAYFRESKRKNPEIVILGPIGEDLKKDLERELLAIQ